MILEQQKTKLAVVIGWAVNALVWCALFGLALYFHQRMWIVLLYTANALLGVVTAGMYVHQYVLERKE